MLSLYIKRTTYKKFNKKCDFFEYIEIANVDLTTGEYKTTKIKCEDARQGLKKFVIMEIF